MWRSSSLPVNKRHRVLGMMEVGMNNNDVSVHFDIYKTIVPEKQIALGKQGRLETYRYRLKPEKNPNIIGGTLQSYNIKEGEISSSNPLYQASKKLSVVTEYPPKPFGIVSYARGGWPKCAILCFSHVSYDRTVLHTNEIILRYMLDLVQKWFFAARTHVLLTEIASI